ncbi:hypothetical protein IPG36_00785 [bacterium]|nr:MAG: hypothetical protein IPG36_00785 [bacterium]
MSDCAGCRGTLVTQADSHNLITFKQLAQPFRRQRGDEYYDSGNWRDSTLAFQRIDPVIAPFDVNAVFIRKHCASTAPTTKS